MGGGTEIQKVLMIELLFILQIFVATCSVTGHGLGTSSFP